MLSSIYKYGNCAYIGGGFGVGIHNILEAATYGIPVIFGPNYYKFKEAKDLLKIGGAYSVKNDPEFYEIFTDLIKNRSLLESKGQICRKYVESNLGATNKIYQKIF
jgi:3-deoxy-D-manno-octulosonic-acid transferase